MDDKLTIFIAVTAAAVVLQMLILLGMFVAVWKLKVRMEGLAAKVEDTTDIVQTRVLPVIDNAEELASGSSKLPQNQSSQDRSGHRQCEPHQREDTQYG